jgi:hypothetical protein
VVALQPVDPAWVFVGDTSTRLVGQAAVPAGVALDLRRGLAAVAQPERRVLAHRLEQPVAVRLPSVVDSDKRLVYQTGEHVEHAVLRKPIARADRLSRLELEPVGEHRQTAEQHALVVTEHVVAPVQRSLECLLPREPSRTGCAQNGEPVAEAFRDLRR